MSQDFETTDWSQVDRWSVSDPMNPYFIESNSGVVWSGQATSRADDVMNADVARTGFGVNGAGIKIGVISDSYNVLAGESDGIASGDLPGIGNPFGFQAPVDVLKDDTVGTDEGRAMVELIHDLAPGAEVLFHSAFNNRNAPGLAPSTTIADAIDALRIAGADIIVDDVGILTAAKYQDGAAAQAVDRAFAAGIPYFSSAGNNADNAYEAIHQSSAPATGFNDLHNFNPAGDFDQVLDLGILPPGAQFTATLWWEDAYASLGGAATTDMSLLFVAQNLAENVDAVVEADQDQLAGADAFEFGGIVNPFPFPLAVGIAVDRVAGEEAKLLSIEVLGQEIVDDNDTDSPTIHGHNAAKGAVAVAAQFFGDPGLEDVEPFSAVGPTTILFDEAGDLLPEPEFRATPQITGIDGTDTTFFPATPGADIDANGFPNFFGTSAAAPHVAAVAALVLELADKQGVDFTPTELYELLFASTVDIETPGFDNLSGFGRLDASLALAQVPEPGSALLLVSAAAWAVAVGRRRRVRPGPHRVT
ncbi:MAG: S8 family serine peptidase [Planctomycetota bacterium]